MKIEDGDRVQDDHGEQTVVTPLSRTKNPGYNFGPASSRDTIVWTCERPGGEIPRSSSGEEGEKIKTSQAVKEWAEFMSTPDRAITHVIVLLDDSELNAYESPGLIQAYKDVGIAVHHIPYSSPNSYLLIMSCLDSISAAAEQQQQQRAVVHCTHGMGRSGRVAAGWLVHRYGLSVDDAVDEALEAARLAGVERMGSPKQLEGWIAESSKTEEMT